MRANGWLASLLMVLGSIAVAGCLDPAATKALEPTVPVSILASLTMGDTRALDTAPLLWAGAKMTQGATDTRSFHVDVPDGYWTNREGALEVSIRWPSRQTGGFDLTVLDAAGAQVAKGRNGWFASVALVDHAKGGDYKAVIKRTTGSDLYSGVIQIDSREKYTGPVRDLLPDLVTMGPIDLQIREPGLYGGLGAARNAAPGCGLDETGEHQATRCLRVSNAVGNTGEGPLEVRMTLQDGLLAPTGLGKWIQRIHRSDGSVREEVVGTSEFHATHGHFHYKGLASFALYKYDADAQARGAQVGKGQKNGFCFFDIGLVKLGLNATVGRQYDGSACLNPSSKNEWYMGLSTGWFDFYSWDLPDQYVDIAGVPDGTYELVSHADGPGTLKESDKANNEASVVFQLTGNTVKVLSTKGFPQLW